MWSDFKIAANKRTPEFGVLYVLSDFESLKQISTFVFAKYVKFKVTVLTASHSVRNLLSRHTSSPSYSLSRSNIEF